MAYAKQYSSTSAPTVGATSVQVLPERTGKLVRTQLIITNTTSSPNTTYFTVVKGDTSATLGRGIILSVGAAYLEGSDGGYLCWQGPVQVIGSDANGTISVVESFIEE